MNEQNPENGQDGKPPSSLSLRLSSVITFIFLSTAAIVIAYIWGVMVGRSGGVPEYAKNEIVRNETKKEIDTPAKNSTQAILAPQDLDYARVLRNEKARERIKQSTPGKAESEKNPTTENAIASTAQATEKPAEILDKKSGDTDLKPTAETTAQNNTAGMFDYVFQLGAFKDEDTVDALRQKLEGRGLRTRMQRDGKLFLVFVLLRGTPERAEEVPSIAKDLRLGEPIVRSKKAAPTQE